MDQNSPDQNKNEGLFPKNQIYTIIGVIIVLAAIIFFVTRGGDENQNDNQANDQHDEQMAGENTDSDEDADSETPMSDQASGTGNVSASGTLRASDNPQLGNLMVESNRGKIYVSTKRDFSSQIGQEVTMQAEGTLNKFTFLGFADEGADLGGAPDEDQTPAVPATNVTFKGKLDKSSSSRGNYTITAGSTVVYFQTVRDYTAWVGSDVTLHATGTINSFTNGKLVK